MDETRYSLREFRDTDYDAMVALQNAIDVEEPQSVETVRHTIETFRQLAQPHQVVVTDRTTGEMVGAGAVFRMPFESVSGRQWIFGSVLPSRQRDGVGSYLYDNLSDEARRRGATSLVCHVRESSSAGRAFMAKRHFIETRRTWRSRLDLGSADTSQLPGLVRDLSAAGIEVTTLSHEGKDDLQVLHRIYDLDSATAKDIPRDGGFSPIPFEQFRQFFLTGENFVPDAWFLAKASDQYVGISSGARESAQPDVLQQYFTGTRPEFRRKRIALALKLMLIDYAKKNGYARIETSNDSLNEPMWTLNRGLGFRKVREMIQLEAKVRGTAER